MSYDQDPGDLCPTEVSRLAPSIDHLSFRPAVFPVTQKATDYGREQAKKALELAQQIKVAKRATIQFKKPSGWVDTPEGFKRLIARSAGLELAVCNKSDEQLTHAEKVAIRNCAAKLIEYANAVFAI